MAGNDRVWCEGDGVRVSIGICSTHTIDEPDFHRTVFTPFAAWNPSDGVRHLDDGSVHIGAGRPGSLAYRMEWEQTHAKLLHRLLDGYERADDEWGCVYVGRKYLSDRTGFVQLRLSDLFWKNSSEGAGWGDLPQLLEERFKRGRKVAWELAWALVRAAHLSDWGLVDKLIFEAASCQEYGNRKKDATACEERFKVALETAIATLKAKVLP